MSKRIATQNRKAWEAIGISDEVRKRLVAVKTPTEWERFKNTSMLYLVQAWRGFVYDLKQLASGGE